MTGAKSTRARQEIEDLTRVSISLPVLRDGHFVYGAQLVGGLRSGIVRVPEGALFQQLL